MSKTVKQNWFESPLITRNTVWSIRQEKVDIYNTPKYSAQERLNFMTPSRQSRPIQMQRNHKLLYNHSVQTENDRFEDINLPDMFQNTVIRQEVISEKINFEDSPILSEEDDCETPSNKDQCQDQADQNYSKDLPKTAVKERHKYHDLDKKTRPKQKGLRMLSQKAFQIVMRLNGATYKQVANQLVDELARQDSMSIDRRDQQNIKRRVYDALNVLIALGILKKDGRKICGARNKINGENSRQEDLKDLFKDVQTKQFRIMEKMKLYRNAQIRSQMIKALIKRNSQAFQKHNKIEFPFIALCVKDQEQNKVAFNMNKIQIYCSQRQIQPFGDMDTLPMLRPLLKSFIQ